MLVVERTDEPILERGTCFRQLVEQPCDVIEIELESLGKRTECFALPLQRPLGH